jgi:hypothetical protein
MENQAGEQAIGERELVTRLFNKAQQKAGGPNGAQHAESIGTGIAGGELDGGKRDEHGEGEPGGLRSEETFGETEKDEARSRHSQQRRQAEHPRLVQGQRAQGQEQATIED